MEKQSNQYYYEKDKELYLQAFKRFPVVLERGEGSHVWDVEGREYIDALAGIAVTNVGHCHPKVVKAIQEQAAKLLQASNFYLTVPQVELSEKLLDLSGMDRIFFTNSGAESVEGAIKIARKYAHSLGRGGCIISFEGCFHGRTMATIATGKEEMQKGFEPVPEGFMQIPWGDMKAVMKAAGQDTAAIIIEPVQGEGGIRVADKEFIRDLRALCHERHIVLIFDEIQCGMGRTGEYFAKDHYGVEPDIMALAKALGGGVPIGAILANEKVSDPIDYGDHGTTFGGNPLVCAASLATLEVIEEENLLQAAREKGEWLKEQLRDIKDAGIREVRGLGLMIGVEFEFETKPLVEEMLKEGVIANATAGNVLRLVPPLNIGQEELEKLVEVIRSSVKKIRAHA